MTQPQSPLSIAECASLACLFEATAQKPGNVNRGADFESLTFVDFAVSAQQIAPAMAAAAAGASLGETVHSAISATRRVVPTNTNLGMVLLMAPLAMVPRGEDLHAGVQKVLDQLTPEDCHRVYEAIRLAEPGGMGKVEEADINEPPPDDLIAAMRLAADRDLIARQYVNGFREVLDGIVPWIEAGVQRRWSLDSLIVHVFLKLMSEFPDSLIARKCGQKLAEESSLRARRVLDAGQPGEGEYHVHLADFDFWLRSDGARRNPGTSADMVAAGLFVALREGIIKPPFRFYG